MVTVGSAWTPPEDYFDKDDGTYAVTLIRIGVEDKQGNFVPGATRTYDGQFGEKTVQDWRFALEDGQIIDASVAAPRSKNGEEVIHPKSTYYAYATALFGKAIPEGTTFDPQQHLIGRMALATIARDQNGYPRIANLGAMPSSMQPSAAAVPVAAAVTPLREQVAPTPVAVGAVADDLPF
jgi:hypothetical protein